jgi:hypothetical protein
MSDSVISLDASLPLAWEDAGQVSQPALEQRSHANLSLLKALSAIDAATQERDEAPEAMRKHLERVESKLDVLLMLVAKLTLDNTQLPLDCEVKLSPTQISWKPHQSSLPSVGQTIAIRLFLTIRVPQPLVLQAVVRNSGSDEVRADLLGLDEELDEWITRTIFRYHRRAVHARKQP